MLAKAIELMELYEVAIDFEKLGHRELIKPGQLFVIQDPETDLLGFCVLNKELQLNVYLGVEGLIGYLESIYDNDNYLLSKQTCLTLDFKPFSELDVRDILQLEKLGFNLTEAKQWPQFKNFSAGFLPDFIKNSWECRFFTQVIKQFILIGKEISVKGNDFNLVGDEVLFYSHTDQGDWQMAKVSMNVFLKQLQQQKFSYENELEAYRINHLPTIEMTFELTQFLLPKPVKKIDCERGFFPLVTAAFESKTKRLVFAEITDSGVESQTQVIKNFASMLLNELKFKPDCFVTDSQEVITFFTDFCQKTNIKLEQVTELEAPKDLMAELIGDAEVLETIQSDVSGFEREMAVILETAKGVCRTILNSNLLNSKLASEARHKFTSVIELIHVVMLGNFKQLPDDWTANNMEIAYHDILPSLLSEEELSYVPDIIASYVDIVGEAEALPNYQEIKHRMELLKR